MLYTPLLARIVIESLEALATRIPSADFVGTNKEAGVKYLLALIKHSREPTSRAPFVTKRVIDSLEALLADMPPAAYIHTEKVLGVQYLTSLIEHHRDPESITKRKKKSETTLGHRRKS